MLIETWYFLFMLQLKRGFTGDIDIIGQVVRGLGASGSYPRCDLSELFRMAAAEAQQSIALNRRLRVVTCASVFINQEVKWKFIASVFEINVDSPTNFISFLFKP